MFLQVAKKVAKVVRASGITRDQQYMSLKVAEYIVADFAIVGDAECHASDEVMQ
tara:strand:+ start:44 stop:205 length:162 start_codon:yes stop_codon:yes gene_type:complete